MLLRWHEKCLEIQLKNQKNFIIIRKIARKRSEDKEEKAEEHNYAGKHKENYKRRY